MTLGFLGETAKKIESKCGKFNESDLEDLLSSIYSADYLAAMLLDRYAKTPRINEFTTIIRQAVQAHFQGMHHISICGLLPVIEGAGKLIARDRIHNKKIGNNWYKELVEDCVREVTKKSIGIPGEWCSLLLSFRDYAEYNLYEDSTRFSRKDGTNRHGILHGHYNDSRYGRPLNFYKCIGAIDFLCLVSKFKHPSSFFASSVTEESMKLADYFLAYAHLSKSCPWSSLNFNFNPEAQ